MVVGNGKHVKLLLDFIYQVKARCTLKMLIACCQSGILALNALGI